MILGAIPLVDSNGELLPVQFPVDPGENNHFLDKNQELSFTDSLSLLNSYLDIVKLDPQVFKIKLYFYYLLKNVCICFRATMMQHAKMVSLEV